MSERKYKGVDLRKYLSGATEKDFADFLKRMGRYTVDAEDMARNVFMYANNSETLQDMVGPEALHDFMDFIQERGGVPNDRPKPVPVTMDLINPFRAQ